MEDIKRTQIAIYQNALSDEMCDDIINWYDKRKHTFNPVDSWKRKDCSVVPQMYGSWMEEFDPTIVDAIYKYYNIYRDQLYFDHYTIGKSIGLGLQPMADRDDYFYKLQKSESGGGFCTWHCEYSSNPPTQQRYVVWMFYLNDTDSGYTEFKYQNMTVKPTKGTLVLWPAYWTHPHRAAPDLKEDKYILTGWLHANREGRE